MQRVCEEAREKGRGGGRREGIKKKNDLKSKLSKTIRPVIKNNIYFCLKIKWKKIKEGYREKVEIK